MWVPLREPPKCVQSLPKRIARTQTGGFCRLHFGEATCPHRAQLPRRDSRTARRDDDLHDVVDNTITLVSKRLARRRQRDRRTFLAAFFARRFFAGRFAFGAPLASLTSAASTVVIRRTFFNDSASSISAVRSS